LAGCNLVFCLRASTDLQISDETVARAVSAGATITDKWHLLGPLKSTHLICDDPNAALYHHVRSLMWPPVVTPLWLQHCVAFKTKLREKPYFLKRFEGTPLDISTLKLPFPELFTDFVFEIDPNLPRPIVAQLIRLLVAYGGHVGGVSPPSSIPVIAKRFRVSLDGHDNGPVSKRPRMEGEPTKIVSAAWVATCIRQLKVTHE